MKTYFQKQPRIKISYRDYQYFHRDSFRNKLDKDLSSLQYKNIDYDTFEDIIIFLLKESAPVKFKYVRATVSPYINKTQGS